MEFMLKADIKKPDQQISYKDKILLTGSCFTEHIGNAMSDVKFSVLQNPNGILFDPASVSKSLVSYVSNYQYTEDDLFYFNEVWNSWQHHSRFSHISKEKCLEQINASQLQAHNFLKEAEWLIITLGSSFHYLLNKEAEGYAAQAREKAVGSSLIGAANCHRAPGQWFTKHLLGIDETITLLDNAYHQLKRFNPKLKIIFTISPVRHIRDGVVENNRSKARLIEAVHHLVNKFSGLYYFPAYELVIDVLRDYRFYDVDMVHPNYPATAFVMETFRESFIAADSQALMEEVRKIVIARKHKAFQPETNAHKNFLQVHAQKAEELMNTHPFLNLQEELNYFLSV
jgi:GSCFA family